MTSPAGVWGVAMICWALLYAAAAELDAGREAHHDARTATMKAP